MSLRCSPHLIVIAAHPSPGAFPVIQRSDSYESLLLNHIKGGQPLDSDEEDYSGDEDNAYPFLRQGSPAE